MSTAPGSTATPGTPRVLSAPWRERYLKAIGEAERVAASAPAIVPPGSSGSFLRDYWLAPEQDEANLVVLRRSDAEAGAAGCGGMALLNLYPYANGHLLVALGDARGRLLEYEPAQRAALWRMVDDAAAMLARAVEPQGLNIGVNEGRAAGAGVPQHLHVHLIPRWLGDVNFMTAVGGVRVIPGAAEDMARRLRAAWADIARERGGGGR